MVNGAALVIGESLVDVGEVRGRTPTTPAAVPPTWRSRWPAWAGRPGWPRASRRTSTARCSPATSPATTCGSPGTRAVERSSSAVATGLQRRGVLRVRPGLALNPVRLPEGVVPVVVHACSIAAVLPPGARTSSSRSACCGRPRRSATTSTCRTVDQRHRARGGRPGRAAGRRQRRGQGLRRGPRRRSTPASRWPTPPRACSVSARRPWWSPAAVTAPPGSGAGRLELPALPVQVADTIGAGDTFGAALPCTRSASAACWAPSPGGAARRSTTRARARCSATPPGRPR